MRRWTAGLLALLLFCGLAATGLAESTEAATEPMPAASVQPYDEKMDGNIRVWLQSLGVREALGLTLAGTYSVDGDRGFQFEQGTEISLGLDGGHIMLKVGGAAIDMGGGFTLVRHLNADGSVGGAYIHEGEKDTLYNGDIAFAAKNDSIRATVKLSIEEYLYGVVPYEMAEHFPLEALKAQAVAARTYAMQRKARNEAEEYDVVDTTSDQVFKGYEAQYSAPIRAVDETRGIVGMFEGRYAECVYSASNGGQTALASDVWGSSGHTYFDMRDDAYDLANPQSIVKTATLTAAGADMPEALAKVIGEAVAEKLTADGKLAEGEMAGVEELLNVEAVDPIYGGASRQYGTIRFTIKPNVRRFVGDPNDLFRALGDPEPLDQQLTIDLSFYDQVRQALGIGINASTYDLVSVEKTEAGFVVTNRRYGHGVGMSQRGAEQMAGQHGMTYLEILGFYYPGLDLMQITWHDTALTAANALPDSLGYAAPRPTAAPTPAPLPALSGSEYYAVVTIEGKGADSTVNVRSGPSTEDGVIGELRNGSRLIVEEETESGWVKMKTVELQGYIMQSFTTKE